MGTRDGNAPGGVGSLQTSCHQSSGASRTSGPRFGLVRVHIDSGLVAKPAFPDARGTAGSNENGADHTTGERKVRRRTSLSALGAQTGREIRDNFSPKLLGNPDSRPLH